MLEQVLCGQLTRLSLPVRVRLCDTSRDDHLRLPYVQKEVWDAANGQVLPCQQEHSNVYDPHAVAVVKRGVIVAIVL